MLDIMDDTDDSDLGPPQYGEASHYCKHGTYIGSWAGPDYMCGACEDGVSDEEFEAACKARDEAYELQRIQRMIWNAVTNELHHEARVRCEELGWPWAKSVSNADKTWGPFVTWLLDEIRPVDA